MAVVTTVERVEKKEKAQNFVQRDWRETVEENENFHVDFVAVADEDVPLHIMESIQQAKKLSRDSFINI